MILMPHNRPMEIVVVPALALLALAELEMDEDAFCTVVQDLVC